MPRGLPCFLSPFGSPIQLSNSGLGHVEDLPYARVGVRLVVHHLRAALEDAVVLGLVLGIDRGLRRAGRLPRQGAAAIVAGPRRGVGAVVVAVAVGALEVDLLDPHDRALDVDRRLPVRDLGDHRALRAAEAAGRGDDVDRLAGGRVDGRRLRDVVLVDHRARRVGLVGDRQHFGAAGRRAVRQPVAGGLLGGERDRVRPHRGDGPRGRQEDLRDALGVRVVGDVRAAGCAPWLRRCRPPPRSAPSWPARRSWRCAGPPTAT